MTTLHLIHFAYVCRTPFPQSTPTDKNRKGKRSWKTLNSKISLNQADHTAIFNDGGRTRTGLTNFSQIGSVGLL
ncbi:hypothetical protein LINPERHAP2_LOCUS2883 [Linum perenne]